MSVCPKNLILAVVRAQAEISAPQVSYWQIPALAGMTGGAECFFDNPPGMQSFRAPEPNRH